MTTNGRPTEKLIKLPLYGDVPRRRRMELTRLFEEYIAIKKIEDDLFSPDVGASQAGDTFYPKLKTLLLGFDKYEKHIGSENQATNTKTT